MLKQDTNSSWLRQYKETLELTPQQRTVLIGTVLGDGCLKISRSGKAARLQVCHSVKSKEYVFWKWHIFDKWVFHKPTYYQINNSLIFRTISHPLIYTYMEMFYKGNVKVVPSSINDILNSNLSLAIWFMDDGNGYRVNDAFRISTYSFGLEGNLLLKNCLKRNFGLEVTVYKDTKGYQLYFPIRSGAAHRFKYLIAPYILPSMLYKINNYSPVETHIEGTR